MSFSWFSLGSWANWNLEYWLLWGEENRRTRRKTLGARREPTTNSTHIWHWVGIEPGHISGRPALKYKLVMMWSWAFFMVR